MRREGVGAMYGLCRFSTRVLCLISRGRFSFTLWLEEYFYVTFSIALLSKYVRIQTMRLQQTNLNKSIEFVFEEFYLTVYIF